MSNQQPTTENQSRRDLQALEAIEEDPNISQRDLSQRLGVALGITNALIKTLVRKGLIKIRGENNRTLTYHLTHAGVLHKSRLAMQWTLNTINDYRRLRREVAERLAAFHAAGAKRVILYGANELAEIAVVVAQEAGVEIIGVVDDQGDGRWVAGHQVRLLADLVRLSPDAIINCREVGINIGELAKSDSRKPPVRDLLG